MCLYCALSQVRLNNVAQPETHEALPPQARPSPDDTLPNSCGTSEQLARLSSLEIKIVLHAVQNAVRFKDSFCLGGVRVFMKNRLKNGGIDRNAKNFKRSVSSA